MTYEITNNTQFNSIEIKFDCKPSEAVRDALKALKFRWHKVKKIWYGYADQSTVAAAIEEAEKPLTIPKSKFVDGYGLYDGWEGGNARTWSNDKELKTFILSDFKKAGIKATIRFNRAGFLTSLTATIKMSRNMIKPFDQYEMPDTIFHGWIDYDDEHGDHQCIYSEKFWSLDGEEREKIIPLIKQYAYNIGIKHLQESNTYSCYEIGILTEEGQKTLDTAKKIVSSYNRDCTNSMIDYFDRDIYDHYAIKFDA